MNDTRGGQILALLIGMCMILYGVFSVMLTQGNSISEMCFLLMVGGFLLCLVSPRIGFVLWIVSSGYMDLIKRLTVVSGNVTQLDLYYILGVHPLMLCGLCLSVMGGALLGRHPLTRRDLHRLFAAGAGMVVVALMAARERGLRPSTILSEVANNGLYSLLLFVVPFILPDLAAVLRALRLLVIVYAGVAVSFVTLVLSSGWLLEKTPAAMNKMADMAGGNAFAEQMLRVGTYTERLVGFYLERGVSRPKEQAYLEAMWSRRGYRPGDRVAVIRGGVTSSRAGGKISSYDATRDWLILSSYHLTADRLAEYVTLLNRFRPRHLHAYPSAALMLARGMEQSGLKLNFPLVSVLCGSEKLDKEAQRYLEQFFACRVFHWYGHSERVVLAGQGRQSDHLYFWPAYGFVEFGEPDAEGLCEVIGTSFHNRAMPLIRYRTGDHVRLSKTQDRELPMIEVDAVEGRDYEFLISATARRISLTAINMHDRIFDGLLAVQFAQGRPGEVEFRYQPGPRWQSSRLEAMRAGLLQKLGDDFNLVLHQVPEVEKTPAGKHRWLVRLSS